MEKSEIFIESDQIRAIKNLNIYVLTIYINIYIIIVF